MKSTNAYSQHPMHDPSTEIVHPGCNVGGGAERVLLVTVPRMELRTDKFKFGDGS